MNTEKQAEKNRLTFKLGDLLWAVLWIAIGLSTLSMIGPDFLKHLVDDDGDNVAPRILVLFWCTLTIGVVSSLRGRPLAWLKPTFLYWLFGSIVVVFIALI